MADENKQEKTIKQQQDNIDESSLKQTIDSISLDGLDSLIPEKDTENVKQTKKEATSSLSGIDDITSYIQKQKEKSDRMSPELLTARDGSDLLSQQGIYAVVPHKKNDHKLIYTRENAPKSLLEDPKNRKKGTQYKKGSMSIYDVHVDFAEHPELKGPDGQPLDVRIIDDPKDLDDQLQAIREGKGGGTNFMSPVLSEKKSKPAAEAPKDSKKDGEKSKNKEKEKNKESSSTENKKSEEEVLPKNDKKSSGKDGKKELSLDDILPKTKKDQDTKKQKESTKKTITTDEENKKNDAEKTSDSKKVRSLDDILPPEGIVKEQSNEPTSNAILNAPKKEKKELSLDDILPKTEKEQDATKQKEKNKKTDAKSNENKKTNSGKIEDSKKISSLDDILPQNNEKKSKNINTINEESKKIDTEKTKEISSLDDNLPSSENIKKNRSTQGDSKDTSEVEVIEIDDIKKEGLGDIKASSKESEIKEKDDDSSNKKLILSEKVKDKKQETTKHQKEVQEETEIKNNKAEDNSLQKDSEILEDKKRNPILQLKKEESSKKEDIIIPSLDSFLPKQPQPSDISSQLQNSTNIPSENVQTLDATTETTSTSKPTDVASTTKETPPVQSSSNTTIEAPSIDTIPKEHQETVPAEKPQESLADQGKGSLLDLDEMTFEPIQQSDNTNSSQETVYNDGIVGNETTKETKSKSPVFLIIKIVVALILVGIALWIVSIMVGGSKTTPQDSQSPIPQVEQFEDSQDTIQEGDIQTPPIDSPQDEKPNPEQFEQPSDQPQNQDDQLQPSVQPQTFTLPELISKLEAQQTEARRLLNRAKLLNDREGIKFATAGLLKASKSLDEAAKDPTITADSLKSDAQRVDLYLGQAQSIVE